jgi:leader peptidase (prepilin peptidase)/N-methyltransferase
MLALACGLVGLLVGSFTNVLIARVPQGEEWVRSSSRCPRCRHDLAWYDNIPLLSWLWLRRRCRHCQAPISARYPIVESLVSGLFVAIYLVYGLDPAALGLAYLAMISVALVFIDLDVQRLPDRIVLPAYPVVLAFLVADAGLDGEWGNLGRAGLGVAILVGFYGTMWIAYPAGLGLGDVKSAGVLGMMGGYLGWSQLSVAAIAGPLLGGVAVVLGLATRRIGRKSRVPYGPALFGGAWLGYLAGPAIAHAYISLVT